MRFLAAVFVLATGLLLSGCMSAERRAAQDRDDRRPQPRDPKDNSPWWLDGNSSSKAKSRSTDAVAKTDRETIIAGEVVEGVDRKRLKGRTYITVKPAEETVSADPARRSGVGVETDDDGYFFMSGLVSGKTYILSAVREYDGKKIAAEMMIKPPAGNIRLELTDDKISSVTPPPPLPVGAGPFGPPSATAADTPGWEPGAAPPSTRPAPRPESIAGLAPQTPPTANIRTTPPPAPQPEPPSRLPASRVPNFMVTDLVGRDWEFRQASGRLVLLDFWSTTCGPCMRAVPAMKRLQADYGGSGLEVVAVACEADAPFAERVKPVEEVARRKEMNYRTYVERPGHVGEVQRLFNVQWVPTLVLLDRQGNILWRGGATDTDLTRAEEVIKSYLMKR